MSMTITNIDNSGVIVSGQEAQDGLLTITGTVTVLAGTILARDSVSLKFVPFVKGGVTNENGIPKAVLPYDVVSVTAGAHDEPVRATTKAVIDETKLVIDADGDASNVDNAVLDQLRAYGLTPVNVQQLNKLDTQD